jgi:hypothetical protein
MQPRETQEQASSVVKVHFCEVSHAATPLARAVVTNEDHGPSLISSVILLCSEDRRRGT